MKIIFQLNIMGEKRSCEKKKYFKKSFAIDSLSRFKYNIYMMILN